MKPILITAVLLFFVAIGFKMSTPNTEEKFKGVTYTGPGRGPIPPEMISSIADMGGNYIALVPEATLYRQNLTINYNRTGGWYGESLEASIVGTNMARENNIKVMIKPHIAVGYDRRGLGRRVRGSFPSDSAGRAEFARQWREFLATQPDLLQSRESWRGYIKPKDEADWPTLAENYKTYILEMAEFADSLDAEVFAVGTELKELALAYPDYWRDVIKEIRKVYDGQLTYAANWDSYDKIEFWDELDFIGIDAYFPLSEEKSPTVESLVAAWQPYKEKIQALSQKFGKPVAFTEWGYESEFFAGNEPWEAAGREFANGRPTNTDHISYQTQADLYEAAFQAFWNEPWFVGVFIWRWDPHSDEQVTFQGRRRIPTYNYTPKNKTAEQTLSKWFSEKSN